MNQLPPEWTRWVEENIARGVPEQVLIDTLIQHNFARELAEAAVAGDQLPSHEYEYEEIGPPLGNTLRTSDREISVLMAMDKPRILLLGNVLSQAECEELIACSRPKLTRSTTVDDNSGRRVVHQNRTSNGTFFRLNETPFIARLDRRIAELMRMPAVNGEGLQILNYQIGGEYKPHYDYFQPHLSGSAVHLAHGGQRVASLILYLNTVADGGETVFPEVGITVAPVQGHAVYFAYTNSRNQVDDLTFHGGNPVVKGEKWIATKWMRQREHR